MAAQSLPFTVVAEVKLDASGNGSVSVGPSSYKETWITSLVSTRVATNVKEPVFRAYLGPASAGQFIGGSASGSQDADSSLSVQIPTGQILSGVWEGGDVGATATMTVCGTKVIGD